MNFADIAVAILTSATVSSIITVLIEAYFKTRLVHQYAVELERIKAKLNTQIEVEQEIVKRKLESYPALAELVYRCRNMTRDLSHDPFPLKQSLAKELTARIKELEDGLFQHRLDLERDGIFSAMHRYKRSLQNFALKMGDVQYLVQRRKPIDETQLALELRELHQPIEELYEQLINELAKSEVETSPTS